MKKHNITKQVAETTNKVAKSTYDAKANRHIISLCEDQTAHLVQIGGTASLLFVANLLTR